MVAWLLTEAPAAIAAAAAATTAAATGAPAADAAALALLASAHRPALTPELFSAAAESGCEPLMRYLREEQRCPWDATAFAWAAWVGCQRTIAWMAAAGCPMGVRRGAGAGGWMITFTIKIEEAEL